MENLNKKKAHNHQQKLKNKNLDKEIRCVCKADIFVHHIRQLAVVSQLLSRSSTIGNLVPSLEDIPDINTYCAVVSYSFPPPRRPSRLHVNEITLLISLHSEKRHHQQHFRWKQKLFAIRQLKPPTHSGPRMLMRKLGIKSKNTGRKSERQNQIHVQNRNSSVSKSPP